MRLGIGGKQMKFKNGSSRRNRLLVLVASLALLTFILAQPAVVKAQSCTNATLNGTYGRLLQAFYLDHKAVPVGSARVGAETGIVTFDGQGNSSGSATGNADGYIYHVTFTGKYSVNPDCTADVTINLAGRGTATGTYIIVDEGNEFEFLNLSDSAVEFGRFRKMPQNCTNATLNGNYGYLAQGFFLHHRGEPVGSTYVGVSIGVETFDGNGNTNALETSNASGIIFHQTLTGTYSVNADCTATATMTFPDGGTATATFTIVDGGNELEFLNLWDSAVEVGRFRKQ
jgi:hypothetical protein